jgi:hypothetical protein
VGLGTLKKENCFISLIIVFFSAKKRFFSKKNVNLTDFANFFQNFTKCLIPQNGGKKKKKKAQKSPACFCT